MKAFCAAAIVIFLAMAIGADAKTKSGSAGCSSTMKPTDVLVEYREESGTTTLFRRNQALEIAQHIRDDIQRNPVITTRKEWRPEFATNEFWIDAQKTSCSGTKDCGSMDCKDPNETCKYRDTGKFGGCKCV